MILKIFFKNLVLILILCLATIMAADDYENAEKGSIRGALSVTLAVTLATTDPVVTGPPIAFYAMCCAAVDSTKFLCNRIRCLGYNNREERAFLNQQADRQFVRTLSYASASLLILNDSICRLRTGYSSNIGAVALALIGAADD